MTNDDVKEYLYQYQRDCDNQKDLQDEVEVKLSEAMSITSMISDMPRGNGKAGFEDVVVKYLEICSGLTDAITAAEQSKIKISGLIKSVGDYRIEKVLYKLYIKADKRKDIAENMGYDLRHIDRLHAEGIEIIKHVLECQSIKGL